MEAYLILPKSDVIVEIRPGVLSNDSDSLSSMSVPYFCFKFAYIS